MVGGFSGTAATNRFKTALSIVFGFLGAAIANTLNEITIFLRTGGFIYSGVADVSAVVAAIFLYGGTGALLGILVNYFAAGRKLESE